MLLKRALGYEYTEKKIEIEANGGKKITQTVKHMAPDTTAQIFWLKNRRPDKWRDRQINPDDVPDSVKIELETDVKGFAE